MAIKDGVKTIHKYSFGGCNGSLFAESVAISKGVELIRKTSDDVEESTVKTDCLNLVERYGGRLKGVRIQWIPRRLNLAHEYSVIAREEI